MDDPTAALCAAIAAWVTRAAHQIPQEKLDILQTAVNAENADLYVVVRLREGAIVLDAVNRERGLRNELFRQEVEPLRPFTGFADQQSRGQH